jgi:hypothetical protein
MGYQPIVLNAFSADFGKPIIAGIPMQNLYPNNGQFVNNYSGQMNPYPNSISNSSNSRNTKLIQKLDLERNIRSDAKWFTGCNTFWAVILFISLILRVISNFDGSNDSDSNDSGGPPKPGHGSS